MKNMRKILGLVIVVTMVMGIIVLPTTVSAVDVNLLRATMPARVITGANTLSSANLTSLQKTGTVAYMNDEIGVTDNFGGWIPTSTARFTWVEVNFGETVNMNSVKIYKDNGGTSAYTYEIKTKNLSGDAWTTVATGGSLTVKNAIKCQDITFSRTIQAKYIRIEATWNDLPRFTEMEVMGTQIVGTPVSSIVVPGITADGRISVGAEQKIVNLQANDALGNAIAGVIWGFTYNGDSQNITINSNTGVLTIGASAKFCSVVVSASTGGTPATKNIIIDNQSAFSKINAATVTFGNFTAVDPVFAGGSNPTPQLFDGNYATGVDGNTKYPEWTFSFQNPTKVKKIRIVAETLNNPPYNLYFGTNKVSPPRVGTNIAISQSLTAFELDVPQGIYTTGNYSFDTATEYTKLFGLSFRNNTEVYYNIKEIEIFGEEEYSIVATGTIDANNNVNINTAFKNNSTAAKNYQIFVATYTIVDGFSQLKNIYFKEETANSGTTNTFTNNGNAVLTGVDSSYKVKLFIFEKDTLSPFAYNIIRE